MRTPKFIAMDIIPGWMVRSGTMFSAHRTEMLLPVSAAAETLSRDKCK